MMKLTVGKKLGGSFLILCIIVVITALTGIIMLQKVEKSSDIILKEKSPLKDVAMEAVITLEQGSDASKEYLLSESGLSDIEMKINDAVGDLSSVPNPMNSKTARPARGIKTRACPL